MHPSAAALALAAAIFARGLAEPACVLAPNGKMLCCAANDYECIEKAKKAHAEPASHPPSTDTRPQSKSWMFGSMYTFANATVWETTSERPFDVVVVGTPFGYDTAHEAPGLQLIRRETSRMGGYSRLYGTSIQDLVVVDGQDLVISGNSMERFRGFEAAALPFFKSGKPVVALGGDQSITVPLLRAAKEAAGDFAVIHIDKDLAIGSGSREQALTASTAMFWGAATSLFDTRHSLHVGARGNLDSQRVELIDQELGFQTILAEDIAVQGVSATVNRIKDRLARRDGTFMPAYLSLDLDVLDPAYFPGREPGGLSVKELRALLAGLRPFCVLVGAELRDVAPLSEAASLKVAAALAHDLVLLAGRTTDKAVVPPNLKHEL